MQAQQLMDLDTLLRSEKPVFVTNQTKPKGILVVAFPTNGRTERVTIPKTSHPFNLSARVPRQAINDSTELRRFLSRGLVSLVDPEIAFNLLKDPDVAEELREAEERTYNHGQRAKEVSASDEPVASSAQEAFKKLMNAAPDSSAVAAGEEDAEPQLNLRAKVTVQRLQAKEMKVGEALSDLKAISTELSMEDLIYIQSQVPTGRIATWVRKLISRMQAETEETPTGGVELTD
jgi:hypothetical protein